MMRFPTRLALLVGLGAAAPLACSSSERPPAGVGTGAAGGNGAAAGRAISAGRSGAGGGGSTATGGQGGESTSSGGSTTAGRGGGGGEPNGEGGQAVGGTAGYPMGTSGSGGLPPVEDCELADAAGAPGMPSSVCDPDGSWGTGIEVPIPAGGGDVLFSITPDELTIAWGSDEALGGALWIADRSARADDFGTRRQITDMDVSGVEGLALGPDRLLLVAVAGGRFVELTRTAPDTAFSSPSNGSFSLIDADANDNGLLLADPVIAPDDRTLYYSITNGSIGDSTLRVSMRADGEPWPVGEEVPDCEFVRHVRGMRQPTGVSSDGLTLFYFDAARLIARAAFRPAPDEPFTLFVDLGDRLGAQPNLACDRLYYYAPGTLPLEVQVAAAE